MNNKWDKERVVREAINDLQYRNSSSETWVILFEGNPIKLRSGKSSWRKKNHATSALSNHFYGMFSKFRNGWSPSEVTKLLQDEGLIEIKKL